LSESAAAAFEAEHVHRVYDRIARHFSDTRYLPWPRMDAFLAAVPRGSLIADVGCGNGKYMRAARHVTAVGIDASLGLLQCCRRDGQLSVVQSDILAPGLRPRAFDAVLCVAVLHHISTPARRLRAVEALARLLRPGGRALITVWAKEQEATARRRFDASDVLVAWKTPAPVRSRLERQEAAARAREEDRARQRREQQERRARVTTVHDAVSDVARTCAAFASTSSAPESTGGPTEAAAEQCGAPIAESKGETKQELRAGADADEDAGKVEESHRYYHVFVQGELDALVRAVAEDRRRLREQEQPNYPVAVAAASETAAVRVGEVSCARIGPATREQGSHKVMLPPPPYRDYVPNQCARLRGYAGAPAAALGAPPAPLIAGSGPDFVDIELEDSYYDKGNWCVVMRKTG
jgi:alkylated DNA repair protein alkB family protein 8